MPAKIKSSAVEDWVNRMNNIKQKSTDDLTSFLQKVNSASSYFEGNSAEGLFDNIKEFISTASDYTGQLANMSNTLETIVEVMKNQ